MNEDFMKILDTFSAIDGGISFVHLKYLVEEDNEHVNKILKDMARLIDIANMVYKKWKIAPCRTGNKMLMIL